MRVPRSIVWLPCALALEDEATLLSMHRAGIALSAEMASANLLEAASSRNVTQMQDLMQSLVQDTIQGDGIAELDDDIKAALKVIEGTLLKGIRDTLLREHDLDQKAIMDQLKCFDTCREERTLSELKCNEHWTNFDTLWGEHKACRSELYTQYISKIKACNDLDVWVDGFELEEQPEEECVYDAQYECRNKVCEEGKCQPELDDEFGQWLRRIINQAEGGLKEWTRLHNTCKTEYHSYIATDSKCDVLEKKQESANADGRQCVHESCTVDYTKCRADCISEYHKTVKRVECAEKDRKIDWSASEKIECYIRILLNSPTEKELQKRCKDKSNCLNEWRTEEFDKCNDVCATVDFDSGSYELHTARDEEYGERLYISDIADKGKDGKWSKRRWHHSTHKDIQLADNQAHEEGANSKDAHKGWVNTTHRGEGEATSGRCTQHLDIDFQPIPCATRCPEPRPCCDTKYAEKYENEFLSLDKVKELSTTPTCPRNADAVFGEHMEKWAYNLCKCDRDSCELVGESSIPEDDYCLAPPPTPTPPNVIGPVCVKPSGDGFGTFNLGAKTCLERLTFKWKSGKWTNSADKCGEECYGRFGNHEVELLNLVVAKNRQLLLPHHGIIKGVEQLNWINWPASDEDFSEWYNAFWGQEAHDDGLWYTLAPAKARGDELSFQIKEGVIGYEMEGEYQLWMGEDLMNWRDTNNEGMVCFDIEYISTECKYHSDSQSVNSHQPLECSELTGFVQECPENQEWAGTGTCAVLVNTDAGNCKSFCEDQGKKCAKAMDNTAATCTLYPEGHARQTQEENGCLQNWGNQICVCSN